VQFGESRSRCARPHHARSPRAYAALTSGMSAPTKTL
jgi:hypothetical protein